MKNNKRTSVLWTVIASLLILFLIHQNMYVDHSFSKGHTKTDIPDTKTVFFTVKEHQFTMQKKGFDSLFESLKLWEYDEDKETVYLREESLLPTKYTPLMVIFDKGNDSFEKQENILPISSFPFSLKDSGSSFQVNHVDKDGTVYFQYRDKELSVAEGETYRLLWMQGFRLKMTTIENHGLFDKKQFKVLKSSEKSSNRK
ncbi:hypothetical protein [Bacillus toyonensis]|uniref:hypothetical protein n=1 Tax=Bacillus toyonensis TaxID=155322 RepID=UPI002E1BC133|nr:hypothetical protein [Bacillus toyonensis]